MQSTPTRSTTKGLCPASSTSIFSSALATSSRWCACRSVCTHVCNQHLCNQQPRALFSWKQRTTVVVPRIVLLCFTYARTHDRVFSHQAAFCCCYCCIVTLLCVCVRACGWQVLHFIRSPATFWRSFVCTDLIGWLFVWTFTRLIFEPSVHVSSTLLFGKCVGRRLSLRACLSPLAAYSNIAHATLMLPACWCPSLGRRP